MPHTDAAHPTRSWVEDEYWDEPMLPHLEVSEAVPVFTGLLDAAGNEIWRDPEPLGFHHPLSD